MYKRQDKTEEGGGSMNDYLLIGLCFLIGVLFGAVFIYSVEINTMNQALDSMSYCYDTYVIPYFNRSSG